MPKQKITAKQLGKWLLYLIFWPISINVVIWRQSWPKSIKVAAIFFFWVLLIMLFSNNSPATPDSKSPTVSVQESVGFGSDDAQRKVQTYQIKQAYKQVPKGATIQIVYTNLSDAKSVKNAVWEGKATDKPETYEVGFVITHDDGIQFQPRWLVTQDEITALNGPALTITPELKSEVVLEGSERDLTIYKRVQELQEKYNAEALAKDPNYRAEEMDAIWQRVLSEVAQEFNVTPKQVEDIYLRVDLSRLKK